jgi:hypothetical protein
MAILVHVTTMMASGLKYIMTNKITKNILRKSPVWPSSSSNLSVQVSLETDPSSLVIVKGSDLLKQYGVANIAGMIQVTAIIFLVRDLLFTFIADKGCTMA